MTFEAPIFIPSGKKKRDIGTTIILYSFGLMFLVFLISEIFKPLEKNPFILGLFIVTGCVVPIIIAALNFGRLQPLNGQIKGTLKIDDTQITFGERLIKFDDITDFDFDKYFDFDELDCYEQLGGDNNVGNSFRPRLSQGVLGNCIHITTKEGESIAINFRLNSKEHGLQLKPLVRILVLKNKMHFIRATSLLKLNYKEIQELKKEMEESNTA
jgi:hypothetical protein